MPLSVRLLRPFALGLMLAMAWTGLAPFGPVDVNAPVKVRAIEVTHEVDGQHDFRLPQGTSHVAIHWPGHQTANVRMSFSADSVEFSIPAHVELDEVGLTRRDGHTYGAITSAEGMRVIRVLTDRPLPDVTVLALDAGGNPVQTIAAAAPYAPIPAVISRAGWGADESLRFDANGEIWTRAFYPLQKFIIHHTATGTGESNPAATVRAIYHYHAVTQGWGDIGYQYLIDTAGRVYEGRHSRDYAPGVSPTADNDVGLVVEAGHSYHHNPGSMGIALIGTFTNAAPPSAAQASLVSLVSWAAVRHGVDPRIWSNYVNPATGTVKGSWNVTGHRDYNATGCPGTALYALLPGMRSQIAAVVIERLAGADRYATAAAVSAATFAPGVPLAYIATGTNFPDALAGAAAAGTTGGPVLLVTPTSLPPVTAAELTRLQPGKIVVLGSTGAVSEAVSQALVPYTAGPVERLAGADRYATAAAVSAATFAPGVPVAYIATGTNFPDALAGAAAAGTTGGPVLLVTGTTIPGSTAWALGHLKPGRIVILGGGSVVSEGLRVALGAYAAWPASSVPVGD